MFRRRYINSQEWSSIPVFFILLKNETDKTKVALKVNTLDTDDELAHLRFHNVVNG
jgi:hypothetical protein